MVRVDIVRMDDNKIVFIIFFFLYSIMFDHIQFLIAKVMKKWQILAFLLDFLYFCIGFKGKSRERPQNLKIKRCIYE